jgi:NADH-quinone oxidoreductase subunit C
MRRYTPKDNVQAKAKYTDRFWVAPTVPKEKVEDEFFSSVVENLKKDGVEVLDSFIEINHLVIKIKPEENIKALKSLRDSSAFKMCVEMSAVDYLAQDGEFEVFYLMLNLDESKRVRVDMRIKEDEAIESIVLYLIWLNLQRESFMICLESM